ncbi:breast cancer metastasis-suppressor 1-like protein [Ceratitis capitata]|uniref:Breast cancer metastasis-suppressor 1-like protein-A n=1 Tax=Ceratitis capitata TaxID=7213 RepID=W8C033_CERCA|nr:breast cancer metastasis-suppressor 1-like protein [Ceratitis capitata]
MPAKNDADASDAEDMSGAESEHSNSSRGHETSDEEANSSYDSSDLDAYEIERQRSEFLQDLSSLEDQFEQLREQYYMARIRHNEEQIDDVRSGRSEEYLVPLRELDKAFKNRIEVAEKLRQYRLENIEHKYQSEAQAALQNYESEKQLAVDQIEEALIEKIRRLEEDRSNVDISWSDWAVDRRASKVRGPGRKKAVTVTGPYIVYMLREEEIIEDWTAIRKALKRSAATTVPSVSIV